MQIHVWIICVHFGIVYTDVSSSSSTKKWFINEHKSIIYDNQPKLVGSDGKGNDYALMQQKNRAELKLNGNTRFETHVDKGMVSVNDKKSGQGVSANKVGSGGMVQAGNRRGILRTNQDNGINTVNLESDSDDKLIVKQSENGTFDAQSVNNRWQINANSQNLTHGTGVIVHDGKSLNYVIGRNSNDELSAVLSTNSSSSGGFSKSSQYRCVAQTVGVSTCYDEWGKKVGEVRANTNNEVIITDSQGVPRGTAKTSKDNDGQPLVILNSGLFTAKLDKQQDFDCPGVPTNSILIKKNVRFKYMNQKTTKDGGIEYDWPACVELEADVVLAQGVDVKNLMFKWTVNILPVGRLTCNDPVSNICSKKGECMYCNLCDPGSISKVAFLSDILTTLCEARGGNEYTIKATVCPPSEATSFLYCDDFTKKLNDVYWKKKGDVDVVFEIYNRKSDTQFQTDWQDLIKRASLIAAYKTDPNVFDVDAVLDMPTEEDVRNWYKFAKADKIACHESVVSYSITGSKIRTDFLLEAATAGGIFKKSDCRNTESDDK